MKCKTFIGFVIRANATFSSFVIYCPLLLCSSKLTGIIRSTFATPSTQLSVSFVPVKLEPYFTLTEEVDGPSSMWYCIRK